MRHAGIGLIAAVLLTPLAAATGPDLSKIDRGIGKEPNYQNKVPKYCLLVFGPDAATRCWLVRDGNAFYVDRNADGDLTANEKVVLVEGKDAEGGVQPTELGELTAKNGVADKTKLSLMLFEQQGKEQIYLMCKAEGRGSQHASADGRGSLVFADSPKEAPVVHFHGPLSLSPLAEFKLARGDKAMDFVISLGTPGHGPGTFACVGYDKVPKDLHPVGEFRFPNKSPGGAPIIVKVIFKDRC